MRKITYILLLVFVMACATVPLTGRKQFTIIPADQMLSLSADSYSAVLKESKLSTNQKYITSIRTVGQNLTAAVKQYLKQNGLESTIEGYQWQYNVIVSDELNAWCMPGGQIAFYEGIIPVCQDDNGVAVVMGHEIAHAIAKHGNERMSQQLIIQLGGVALSEALKTQKETAQQLALLAFGVGTQLGITLPYSRAHEAEADELGLYFMAMAGYDPQKAPVFWERMQSQSTGRMPEFLSTHPDPANRIKNMQKNMPKALEYYNAHRR
jgi:predicted Zn-dependent protease